MDCAIRTDDAMVSRHHARLYWQGGQYFVEDLGSANGVFYQEQRVTRHALSHGDAVRCGSLWLRFVDTGAQPPLSGAVPSLHAADQAAMAARLQASPTAQVPPPQSEPAQAPASPGSYGADDAEEIRRLKRRIEQLQTELRMYRRGSGADAAQKIEDLENENHQLEEQVALLKGETQRLEDIIAAEGADAKLSRANHLITKTSETVQQLNDVPVQPAHQCHGGRGRVRAVLPPVAARLVRADPRGPALVVRRCRCGSRAPQGAPRYRRLARVRLWHGGGYTKTSSTR